MLLSCEAVVAMLAVREPRQCLEDAGRDVALVGLAGAVGVELACSVDSVGIALDDLTLRCPGREKGGGGGRLGSRELPWRCCSAERRRLRSGDEL